MSSGVPLNPWTGRAGSSWTAGAVSGLSEGMAVLTRGDRTSQRSVRAGPGHDEESPEGKERAAIRAAWIGARDQVGVVGLEAASLGLLERGEERPEPRALGPLLDGIVAFHHLEILGLPHVEGRCPRR